LDHLQAYIVLDAVKEIVDTTHSAKREKKSRLRRSFNPCLIRIMAQR